MAQLLIFQSINIMNKSQIVRTAVIKIVKISNPNNMELIKIITLKKHPKEIISFILMLQHNIKIKAIINNR